MNEAPPIYVVDDDPAVLVSVKALLGTQGYLTRCYSSAGQFLANAPLDRCGCVVTDVQMPEISGMELQRRLVAARSVLSVVVVTGVADVPMAVSLMENGAVTLLEKPYDPQELIQAVERGLAASRRLQQQRAVETARERVATLSDQERQVMELLVAGKPNKLIARLTGLGLRTIDRRRQAILEKMGVESLPELALAIGQARAVENSSARVGGQSLAYDGLTIDE